ncbi:MAG TPA: arylesterase [Chthoniobacterales bacterium]|nr:arylesterase [Chthoniobacterales bacterium]
MGTRAKQLRSRAGILASLLLAISVPTGAAPKRDPSGVITIVALGDSLTAGFGLSRKQAYPALLAEKMRAAGYQFEVVNAGASGDTTAGGLRRLPAILRAHQKIDILILELGINDAFRGVDLVQIRDNLQAIIDQTRARHPETAIVVAGMQLPGYSSEDYVSAFGAMFASLAQKNRATLIPFFLEGVAGNPALNQWDRVHPNAAGQRVLAENVWRVLEPVVRGLEAAKVAR